MKGSTALAACLAALLSTAFQARGAETVKLRPMAPLYVDAKGGSLRQPEGVGCSGSTLLVADSGNGRLLVYSIGDDLLTPTLEIAVPQLPHPTHVERFSNGEIFALDRKVRRIVRLTGEGQFQGYLEIGAGPAGARMPVSMKKGSGDRLHVLDALSERVLVVDASGKVEREIALPSESGYFSDLAVDAAGNTFAVDSIRRRVVAAKPDAKQFVPFGPELVQDLDFPTALAADARGRLFVADQNGGGIVVLAQDGSFRGRQLGLGWKTGLLRYPSQICIDASGNLFVADRENNRIQRFATSP
jgi:hypothetical protein